MTSQYPHESFRITTQRVAATLVLGQGAPLRGEFPCAGQSHEQVGLDELGALLNQPAAFVPFFLEQRPAPILVNKRAIRVVEVTPSSEALPLADFGEVRAVELLLDDGTELHGDLLVCAPLGHTRTLDTLNETGRFLLVVSGERVRFVNVDVITIAADAP